MLGCDAVAVTELVMNNKAMCRNHEATKGIRVQEAGQTQTQIGHTAS